MRTFLIFSFFIASTFTGCSSECDCGPFGVRLDVAKASQGHIVAARITGPACEGSTTDCLDADWRQATYPNCSIFYLSPRRGGTCHAKVDFDDGSSYEEDLEFVTYEGCCGGPRLADHRESIEVAMRTNPHDAGVD
jgi:hypothetical protein